MVWIGVLLSCTASTMNALGLNLTRMSSGATQPDSTTNKQCANKFSLPFSSTALSVVGILLSSLCGVVDVVSYGYAPQSTLAPLGSFTLVVNLLLAPILHDEPIQLNDALYTVVIIFGVVLCILSSTTTSSTEGEPAPLTPSDLATFATTFAFRALVVSAGVLVLSLAAHVQRSTALGFAKSLSTGFVYPVVAGMLGGSTALCAKVLTILLPSSTDVDVVTTLLPLALLCATFGISQVVINGHGLSKHSSLVMVPIYSSSFVLSNAMGGGIFFQEFNAFTKQQWSMYGGGVTMVVAGVLLMAAAKQQEISVKDAAVKVKDGKKEQ